MAMDFARLRDSITDKIATDADGKYTAGVTKPTDSDELSALCHYLAKAIIEEIDIQAQIKAGIEVEDGGGTLIGTTRASVTGVID